MESVTTSPSSSVHTHLGALAVEILSETFDDLFIYALGYADNVLGRPRPLAFYLSGEFGSGSLALRAMLGRILSLVHISANLADPFFHDVLSPFRFYAYHCLMIIITNYYTHQENFVKRFRGAGERKRIKYTERYLRFTKEDIPWDISPTARIYAKNARTSILPKK